MTCRECLDRLSPYHDRALGPEEASAVSAHLASCAACGREWEAYGRAMRALDGPPPEPPGLASRVDDAWRSAGRTRGSRGWLLALVVYALTTIGAVIVLRSC
ncbi:MAG: zf-HC2 domain-containing protein [Planctomycetota bacterium]